MHDLRINAGVQLVPIHTKEHPYDWVDEVINLIQQSGLKYEVGAFNTSIEGSYAEVMGLIDTINNYLLEKKCPEWLLNVQYQLRSERDVSAHEKTAKFKMG